MLLFFDNGPLLIAPRMPRPSWMGSSSDTDYARACAVEDGAAVLPAGDGSVVVINGEVSGAAWIPTPPRSAVAALLAFGHWPRETEPTPADVQAYFDELAQGAWELLPGELVVGEGGLVLLHAAGIPGEDTESSADDPRFAVGLHSVHNGSAVTKQVPAGRYRVEFLEYIKRRVGLTPGAYAVLVRLVAAG